MSYPDHSLTPDLMNSSVKSTLNDVHAQPGQNSKPVDCQLRLAYEKLAATEANVYLFKTLKSMNLATNDVTSFVRKQSEIKRVNSSPDTHVMRSAMKSKLVDALAYVKN